MPQSPTPTSTLHGRFNRSRPARSARKLRSNLLHASMYQMHWQRTICNNLRSKFGTQFACRRGVATRQHEIAETLRQRILTGLHFGTLSPGDRLPSVRVLQAEMEADPRVVLAAYRRLERDGLVELRTRSGIFVADASPSADMRQPQAMGWLVDVLAEGLQRGIPAVEMPDRLRRTLTTLPLRAACVECNRDQIIGICTELQRDFGIAADGIELDDLRNGEVPDVAADADLWVTTSFHAADLQPHADRLGKPLVLVSLRADFIAEMKRLLAQQPMYWIVADARFADKLPRIFESAANADNLKVLVVGRDDLSLIPESAPVYVMQAARGTFDANTTRGELMHSMRIFSPESARKILEFIVTANTAAMAADGAKAQAR